MEIQFVSYTPEPELVIARAARVCYDSLKSRKHTDEELIRSCIKRGHESVLEHASATFLAKGVSRALTHQLVRHRLCSFSQRSQRFVDEAAFSYVTPPSFTKTQANRYSDMMMRLGKLYVELLNEGVKKEDARFLLPNACHSVITVTANFREWRHILKLRGSKKAQWEIRTMALEILKKLKPIAPNVFYDLHIDVDRRVIRSTP